MSEENKPKSNPILWDISKDIEMCKRHLWSIRVILTIFLILAGITVWLSFTTVFR